MWNFCDMYGQLSRNRSVSEVWQINREYLTSANHVMWQRAYVWIISHSNQAIPFYCDRNTKVSVHYARRQAQWQTNWQTNSQCGSGGDSLTISGGKTSGMPPTLVVTTLRPQDAASTIAIQKDSVRAVFKNMWPCTSTSLTCSCLTRPRIFTRFWRLCCSFISSNRMRLSPSPPKHREEEPV